ncbi:sensor histidine kinase [Bianquea renquensis]|uniref:Histidine kinase n=1 Tax=Bianquea renquensis TaxID=2763661 RepID=A0A926I1L9_9FIRM|nr:histidine kinase [Bianquea renquensis]MBC8543588.1 histidine kinase [Bianquea renquensis]
MKKDSKARIRTYLRDYRFQSILIRYFVISILFITLPMVVLNIAYGRHLSSNAREELFNVNQTSMRNSVEELDSCFQSIKNMTYGITQINALNYLKIQTSEEAVLNSQSYLSSIFSVNQVIRGSYPYVDSIYVYLEKSGSFVKNTALTNLDILEDTTWLPLYEELHTSRGILQVRYMQNRYPYFMTMICPIMGNDQVKCGAVVFNIDMVELSEYLGRGSYRNVSNQSTLLAIDVQSGLLAYSDEFRLFSNEKEELDNLLEYLDQREELTTIANMWGQDYIISEMASDDGAMRYVYLTPFNNAYSNNVYINDFLVKMVILSIFLELVIAALLARSAYHPIESLMEIVNQSSTLTAQNSEKRLNEISTIKRIMLDTQSKNESLEQEVEERMASLHNAQILALQSQINPHFMYNTLEAIGDTMVLLLGRENEATDMIQNLAILLRISLSTDTYIVPLRDELEHVKLYMQLMEFRYQGDIHYSIEVPDAMLSLPVIKLTLQPLIENAIQHGLRPKQYHGTVRIEGETLEDAVLIHVSDDGVGMTDDVIWELNDAMRQMDFQKIQHIGLRNVYQRIRLIYGDRGKLTVTRGKTEGTIVTIQYPK